MANDILAELRSSLNATSTSGGIDPAYDSVDIEARINAVLVDQSPKFSEVYAFLPKETIKGPTFIWNARTSDNTSSRWAYTYSENVVTSNTNSGTPAQGARVQYVAVTKTVRTDWEVERFLADMSMYDVVMQEVQNALAKHIDVIERQIVTGNAASGYGDANGFDGLRQLVNSYVTINDTDTIFGIQRASGKTYLDAQVIDASGAVMDVSYLDKAITACLKRQGRPGAFVMSYERWDEINSQLQNQQRFGTATIDGGLEVPTYRGVPLLRSRYMDKAGESNTDTKIFLLAAGNNSLKVSVPIQNIDVDLGRVDAVGGFVKSAHCLVSADLTQNVVIDDLAVPQ